MMFFGVLVCPFDNKGIVFSRKTRVCPGNKFSSQAVQTFLSLVGIECQVIISGHHLVKDTSQSDNKVMNVDTVRIDSRNII